MISLPDELFYPNASAITTIMIAKAHIPQSMDSKVFMGRISNDGYEKLKGKRIECLGSQIEEVKDSFRLFMLGMEFQSSCCLTIPANLLKDGAEYSPQQYIPQEELSEQDIHCLNSETLMSLFRAITSFPNITDSLNLNFAKSEKAKRIPLAETGPLVKYFDVKTGLSSGIKGYSQGIIPYISSGDDTNGVVGLVSQSGSELCKGCITVSAFGKAYLQPWNYVARGNGGSSVRVLIPKYNMSIRELFWFIAQINSQKWRFNYARQAIKSRLVNLYISTPKRLLDEELDVIQKLNEFKVKLSELSQL